jgi:MFS family permease
VITATTSPAAFLCTLHVQHVLGLPPEAAGLLFPPLNLAVVAGSLVGPTVAARVGERPAMSGGLLAVAAGALALHAIAPDAPALPSLLGGLVLMGAGLGVASVASTARGTAAVGADDQGLASGVLATTAQLGTAFGLAVIVPVAAARTQALGGGAGAQVAGYELGFELSALLAAGGAAALWLGAVRRRQTPASSSQGAEERRGTGPNQDSRGMESHGRQCRGSA